jgi:hypothetical protein
LLGFTDRADQALELIASPPEEVNMPKLKAQQFDEAEDDFYTLGDEQVMERAFRTCLGYLISARPVLAVLLSTGALAAHASSDTLIWKQSDMKTMESLILEGNKVVAAFAESDGKAHREVFVLQDGTKVWKCVDETPSQLDEHLQNYCLELVEPYKPN